MEPTKISAPQGTQPAHAARAKPAAKDAAAGTDAASAPGGFLALLAALGGDGGQDGAMALDSSPASDADPLAALPSDTAVDAARDAAALAAWQGLFVPPADGALAGGQGTAGAGARDGLWAGSGGVPGMAGALTGKDGGLQGLVAETAMLDTSVDAQGGLPPQGTPSGHGRALSRLHGAAVQRAEPGEAAGLGRARLGGGERHAVAQPAPSAAAATAGVSVAGERAASGAAVEHAPVGASGTAGREAAAPLAEGLLAGAATARGGEAAGGGRSGEGHAAPGSWSDGIAAEAPPETGGADAGTLFADPTQASADEQQVADQVSYWVHQKTQSAELTVHRDGQPVEVSVTLSGNEAHVAFRSDQAQTREMLDQSMAQLSELLRGEGLVLSGMSVGTSAGQGAGQGAGAGGAEPQRDRAGARQAQVVSVAPAGPGALRRGGAAAERAVDIFV